MKRVIIKYEKNLCNHLDGKQLMYRTRSEQKEMKNVLKGWNEKDTWFRTGGYTSTLTVPVTPGGVLADQVRRNMEKGRQPEGTRVKVLEDGGSSARTGLVKPNQFPRKLCQREDCVLCCQKAGKPGKTMCDLNNVGYEGRCLRCSENAVYVGETSKTAYTRIKQHFSNYRAAAAAKLPPLQRENPGRLENVRDCKSWMWEHTRDEHDGVVGGKDGIDDYEMKVTAVFKKCLQRQVNEGVQINKCEARGDKILNSKNEYFTPKTIQTVFRHW